MFKLLHQSTLKLHVPEQAYDFLCDLTKREQPRTPFTYPYQDWLVNKGKEVSWAASSPQGPPQVCVRSKTPGFSHNLFRAAGAGVARTPSTNTMDSRTTDFSSMMVDLLTIQPPSRTDPWKCFQQSQHSAVSFPLELLEQPGMGLRHLPVSMLCETR